jgi:hypothetical protein
MTKESINYYIRINHKLNLSKPQSPSTLYNIDGLRSSINYWPVFKKKPLNKKKMLLHNSELSTKMSHLVSYNFNIKEGTYKGIVVL